MPVDIVRDAAIDVMLRVFERGAFLSAALDKSLQRKKLSDRGRRFLTQLAYGVVRHRALCDHALRPLLRQPLEQLPVSIQMVLRMGVFQSLFCGNVPFPAMVHTSVELAKKRGHAGTARLVNAVLRRAPQSIQELSLPDPETALCSYLALRYSMPEWITVRWLDEFGPERAAALCAASSEEAPVTLRVNDLATSVEPLAAALERAGCAVEKRTPIPEELTLLSGPPPARSKLFHEGQYLVQDPASMLPAHLLEPEAGLQVLDLCAAPGAKTTHIAQRMRDQGLIAALDIHRSKLEMVRDNIQRLGAGLKSVRLVCGDGTRPPMRGASAGAENAMFRGFDRVLVDAPCSGLGTIRRHPELKWRLKPETVPAMADVQRALLRSAVELCENGGLIVYSVCTLTREETSGVVHPLLAQLPVAPEDGPAWFEPWKTGTGQYQTSPERDGLDGFFLMRLRKRS